MKRKKIRIILCAIIILLIILSVGLFIFLRPSKEEPVKKKKVKKKIVKEEKTVQIVDLNSNTRPYAVMINNVSNVWGYQSGIENAYLVYEIIVEGGYTRLMAVFKDKNLDRIGSVRSSRHYFLDYALENDAIYVHFGWSPKAQSDMKSLGVNNINFLTYSKGYIRDTSLPLSREHTAFTSTDKIEEAIDTFNYSKTSNKKLLLKYSADDIDLSKFEGSIVANKIDIVYSHSKSTGYEYDSQNKVYKRYQNGIAHTNNFNEQYSVKNIITYKVSNYTISGDEKNRQDINNIGNGEGYFISNGYAVPITWEKTSRESQTIYRYKNGEEITVNDGNTFIQIQPSNGNLTIE